MYAQLNLGPRGVITGKCPNCLSCLVSYLNIKSSTHLIPCLHDTFCRFWCSLSFTHIFHSNRTVILDEDVGKQLY